MVWLVAGGCVVAGGVVAAIVLGFRWSIRGLMADRMRRKVLVTLKSGEGFAGVLYAADRDCLVLRGVVAVGFGPGDRNVEVDGELLVQRVDVAYLQVL